MWLSNMLIGSWCASNKATLSLLAYCTPRSEWCTNPGAGLFDDLTLVAILL